MVFFHVDCWLVFVWTDLAADAADFAADAASTDCRMAFGNSCKCKCLAFGNSCTAAATTTPDCSDHWRMAIGYPCSTTATATIRNEFQQFCKRTSTTAAARPAGKAKRAQSQPV